MFFVNLLEANMRTKNFNFDMNYYPVTKSTNEDIWELYNQTFQKNLFVITDNQTSGKGRHNNSWFSTPNKSIACSFLLNQVFDKLNFHSLAIPLAIVKGIKKFSGIELQIKWPNDIVYNNKKLAGILIESVKCKTGYLFNIGIGINVNEAPQDFPPELTGHATSLKIINNNTIQREPLLATILNELDDLISNCNYDTISCDWMKHCSHINQNVQFKFNSENISGVFTQINSNGQAVIKKESRKILYDGAVQVL